MICILKPLFCNPIVDEFATDITNIRQLLIMRLLAPMIYANLTKSTEDRFLV